MEVHTHTHTARKKWTHYFWEFLMLFLAVFCGFLAENFREHHVEHNREKQYIKSFYEDLTADENDLLRIIINLDRQVQVADSLTLLMNAISITQPANLIYVYLRGITRSGSVRLNVNDRTIVQLRNAGGMRLIRNKSVSDSMVAYYKEVENLQFLFDESLVIKRTLREKLQPLLNAADFTRIIDDNNNVINPPDILHLRVMDTGAINNCLLDINYIRGLSTGTKKRVQALRTRATEIKKFIAKEYGIKN
jgi:hypothetical protein